MTSTTFPIDIETLNMSRNGAIGLLIRHSIREPMTSKNNMFGARLTEEGRTLATALGEKLKRFRLDGRRPHAFFSSPLDRCVETMQCILEGLGMEPATARGAVQPHPILIEAFMTDARAGRSALSTKTPEQVVLDYLAGQPIPGFGPIHRGARKLLDFVRDNIAPGAFSIFVTHDALVMPFQHHFLRAHGEPGNWNPPLGGCVVYTDEARTWINDREVS